jgi:hypothetical protein
VGKLYDEIDGKLRAWIEAQPIPTCGPTLRVVRSTADGAAKTGDPAESRRSE